MRRPASRRWGTVLAPAVVVTLLLTATPATADITITDPAGPGPTAVTPQVTVSSTEIAPGERIQIKGAGFLPNPTAGTTGDPLVAIRPYDDDRLPAWTIGGADAYLTPTPTQAQEAKYWFRTHAEGAPEAVGTFQGWIQAPAGLTTGGADGSGEHWLRILSGAFFTTTGTRLTHPITFKVPLTVVDKVRLGFNAPTGFWPGTYFRQSAQVVVKGRAFTPDSVMTATFDGALLSGTDLITDGTGVLPATARIAIPADATPGAHTLVFATGANRHTVQITVTAAPTVTVVTPAVAPGGAVAVNLANYVGVAGQGQKVAFVQNEKVLGCIQANSAGAASAVIKLPADFPVGESISTLFNVGLSCIPLAEGGVVNDLPGSVTPKVLSSSPSAPSAIAPASVKVKQSLAVSGSGFTPSGTVTVTNGATTLGALSVGATGTFSGAVTGLSTIGAKQLVFNDGSHVAAAVTTVEPKTVSTTKVSLSPATVSWGADRTAHATLKVGGTAASGKVLVKLGSWSKTVLIPVRGSAAVVLPKTASVNVYKVTVTYAGTSVVAGSAGSATLKVVRAKSGTSLALAKAKVKKTQRARVVVRVALPGVKAPLYATGTVRVYDGTKLVKTYALKSANKGTVSLLLPKLPRGSHRLKVVYGGTSNTVGSTSSVRTLTVT